MGDMVATVGRPPVDVYLGENTAEAIRQAGLSAAAAVLAQNAANSAQALTNFRSTLAEGVSDFAVGAFFSSAETGELRLYKRIVGSPFYQDQGDNVVPLTKGLMLSNGPIATVAGEVGVLFPFYAVGDVRRYGVFPDGVTDWETAFPARVTAVFANSINPLIYVVWPRGFYNGGFNMGPAYSGSRMHFDGAVFANIVHIIWDTVTWIENVHWTGDIGTYDRLGVSHGRHIRLPDTIRMLHDATKNPQGTGNRGVHLQACEDVSWGLCIVDDTGPTQAALPGAQTIWAGFAIQSQGFSGFRGKIHVKNASGHGVYINALDIDVDIRVDGYGKSAIDFTSLAWLEGADSEAQSEQGCGIWLNRVTGRASLAVSQVNATPANDIYAILIDETGVSSVASSVNKPLIVPTLQCEVGDGNRGLNFGEVGAAPANCVVELGKAVIDLRSGETVATGYGMFNVNPTTTANDARMRVVAEEVQFSRSAAQRLFNFKSGTGTRVSSYIKIGSYRANSLSAGGRIVTADGSAQAGVLTFVLEDGIVNYSGGSSAAVKLVEITTCSPHIRGLKIAAASAAGSPVMLATAITDFVLEDIWTDNLRANDHIVITGATRGTVRRLYSKGGGAGIGMTFNGTFADVDFDGLYVTDFTQGFNSGSSMVFTRCTARSCKAISNLTTQTDMTVAQFPAGAQFGCVDWAN